MYDPDIVASLASASGRLADRIQASNAASPSGRASLADDAMWMRALFILLQVWHLHTYRLQQTYGASTFSSCIRCSSTRNMTFTAFQTLCCILNVCTRLTAGLEGIA